MSLNHVPTEFNLPKHLKAHILYFSRYHKDVAGSVGKFAE